MSVCLWFFAIIIWFYSQYVLFIMCYFFFFFLKQKTAYEMRISDWSSDVCSSDLELSPQVDNPLPPVRISAGEEGCHAVLLDDWRRRRSLLPTFSGPGTGAREKHKVRQFHDTCGP